MYRDSDDKCSVHTEELRWDNDVYYPWTYYEENKQMIGFPSDDDV